MMHRVLEIGLRNPLNKQETTPLLDPSWLHPSEDDLASSTTVGRVLEEFGYGEHGDTTPHREAWYTRLMHLGTLVDSGLLGRWVSGETHFGWSVEAVRTELPFFHREHLGMGDDADLGAEAGVQPSNTGSVAMDFSGRADLVLALCDDEGQGALQVVDLKTKGCLAPFHPESPTHGHPLQAVPPTHFDVTPASPAEEAILLEHRLQLTLYSLALEAMEANKPEDQRRRVLPPALLLGANGRVIQLNDDQFQKAKDDLRHHLRWRSAVHLNPSMEEPERLPTGGKTCEQCPFYRGDLRRCGPQGEPLGFN